jgi:hypothetical protein
MVLAYLNKALDLLKQKQWKKHYKTSIY